MLLFFSRQEKQECRFCGEKFDRFGNRCPYCGSLQGWNKSTRKKRTIEGEGFVLLGDPPAVNKKDRRKSGQLENGYKVFLSVVCAVIPLIGQVAGVVIGLIFIDSDVADRRSFGRALLTASIIMFVLSSVLIYLMVLAFMTVPI